MNKIEPKKKNIISVIVVVAMSLVILVTTWGINSNPWNQTVPYSTIAESQLDEPVYWPSKEDFYYVGKNQVPVTMLTDDCVDIAVPLMVSDEEFGKKLYSKKFFEKSQEKITNRLDKLNEKYAIGYIGNVTDFSYVPGMDNKPANGSNQELTVPKVVIRISSKNLNTELVYLCILGIESVRIDYFIDGEYQNYQGFSTASEKVVDSISLEMKNGSEALVITTPTEISEKENLRFMLRIGGKLLYSGIVKGKEYWIDKSYGDIDANIHDGPLVEGLINFATEASPLGIKACLYYGDIAMMPVNCESRNFEWGVKYPEIEREREEIRKTLADVILESDRVYVKNLLYYSRNDYKQKKIELYRKEEDSKREMDSILAVFEASINRNIIDSNDDLFITLCDPDDLYSFIRIIAGGLVKKDGKGILVVTRGEKYNEISDELINRLITNHLYDKYDVSIREVINSSDKSKDGSVKRDDKIRVDGEIIGN